MKEFRLRLKNDTKTLHDKLEQQYPFKELVSATCDDSMLKDVVMCFKKVFSPLVNNRKGSDEFYNSLDRFFSRLPDAHTHNEKLNQTELFALEYLMLGSRIGNKMILEKNSKLVKFSHSEYLTIPFPGHLWKSLLDKISQIEDLDEQNNLIGLVEKAYRDLMAQGILVSKQ